MPKHKIANFELKLFNPNQVIGIRGPWICDVLLNDKLIIEKCLYSNFIYDEKRDLLFYAKYHLINNYYYFTINFYQITTSETCQFTKEFELLYLGELISDHQLEIFNAFHDKSPNTRRVFDFDKEDFEVINF